MAGIKAMLSVVMEKIIPKPISIRNVPSLSVRTPPSSMPNGMASHAPAPTAPKTRPRMLGGMRSNSMAPMIGFNGPAPKLVIKVVPISTVRDG